MAPRRSLSGALPICGLVRHEAGEAVDALRVLRALYSASFSGPLRQAESNSCSRGTRAPCAGPRTARACDPLEATSMIARPSGRSGKLGRSSPKSASPGSWTRP